MTMPIGAATNAYANASRSATGPGMEARNAGGGFSSMMKEAASNTMESLRNAEQMSLGAAAKKADTLDVVQAVNAASVSLETAVAVRDRVIQSYQEILRMPI